MKNQEKARELRRYVCNTNMPNGEAALGMLSRYNIREADLENIYKVCEKTAIEMADWKDQQYAEIIKEECNTSYESGLAEGERKAEARFKEYLENEIKSYKNMDEKFFAMEIKLLEQVKDELFKQN